MKDHNGKEIKIGDRVKFICTAKELEEEDFIGSKEEQDIILNSVGVVVDLPFLDNLVEVEVPGIDSPNYWFNIKRIKVV